MSPPGQKKKTVSRVARENAWVDLKRMLDDLDDAGYHQSGYSAGVFGRALLRPEARVQATKEVEVAKTQGIEARTDIRKRLMDHRAQLRQGDRDADAAVRRARQAEKDAAQGRRIEARKHEESRSKIGRFLRHQWDQANRNAEDTPTPVGVGGLFLILIALVMLIVPVNGKTRLQWLWLTVTGRTQLIVSGPKASAAAGAEAQTYALPGLTLKQTEDLGFTIGELASKLPPLPKIPGLP